jgi:hypothetical protein
MPNPSPSKLTRFQKGGPGRRKGAKGKSTMKAREMIASFVDGNADRLQQWLDEVHDRDGPLAAIKCFSDLIEYHVPKLARHEMTGADEGPVELVVKWLDVKKV